MNKTLFIGNFMCILLTCALAQLDKMLEGYSGWFAIFIFSAFFFWCGMYAQFKAERMDKKDKNPF